MRVHHLNCGTMHPIGGRLVDGRPGVLRRAEMVCHCLLLETDSGLVLVDSGMGTPSVTRPTDWLGAGFVRLVHPVGDASETAVRQVERLGFAASDVRHIVLTHLDLDHAGGLVDFPDATVHVHARELASLRNPRDAIERARYRTMHFAHRPKWSTHADLGESWFGFDAVRDIGGLPPEILLVPLAGHTRGHTGVAVATDDGWLLHAGDAYFSPGEMDPVRPYCPPGLAFFESRMQMDREARIRNQHRLRALVREHGDEVRVLCAHNPVELRRAIHATDTV